MVSKSFYRLYFTCSPVLLLSFLYGCKVGFTQGLIGIKDRPNSRSSLLSDPESSLLGLISFPGTILSVIVCSFFGNRVGRKTFIVLCSFMYAVIWIITLILILVTQKSVGIPLNISFLFFGFSASMHVIIGSIYFGEVASAEHREILGALYSCVSTIGTQIEYFLYDYILYYAVIFPCVISIFCFILALLMIESPHYYISKNESDKARKQLKWLNPEKTRKQRASIFKGIHSYVHEHDVARLGRLKIALEPTNLKLLMLMSFISCTSLFNVHILVTSYGKVVIDSLTKVDKNGFVFVYNLMTTIATTLGLFTIKIFNRKNLILFGFISIGFLELVTALLYFFLILYKFSNAEYGIYVAHNLVNLINSSAIVAGFGTLRSEVFPHNMKEFYSSLLSLVSDLSSFFIAGTYNTFKTMLNYYPFFAIYSAICMIGATVVHFYIVDTKNKTLEQIRMDYSTQDDVDDSDYEDDDEVNNSEKKSPSSKSTTTEKIDIEKMKKNMTLQNQSNVKQQNLNNLK